MVIYSPLQTQLKTIMQLRVFRYYRALNNIYISPHSLQVLVRLLVHHLTEPTPTLPQWVRVAKHLPQGKNAQQGFDVYIKRHLHQKTKAPPTLVKP